MKITTIKLKEDTKRLLDKFGIRGESYDDIVNKLIEGYNNEK